MSMVRPTTSELLKAVNHTSGYADISASPGLPPPAPSPACPFCGGALEHTGWIHVRTNSTFWCARCEKRVEISPFDPTAANDVSGEERLSVVRDVPQVDSAGGLVSAPPAPSGSPAPAELEALRDFLQALQWIQVRDECGDFYETCPACFADRAMRGDHVLGCELKTRLGELDTLLQRPAPERA